VFRNPLICKGGATKPVAPPFNAIKPLQKEPQGGNMTLDLKSLGKTHARVHFCTSLAPVSLGGWGFGTVFPPYSTFRKVFGSLKGGATGLVAPPSFLDFFLEAIMITPSEASEQVALVKHLRKAGILMCAVPNGGKRDKVTAMAISRQGVSRGVPDILIFDAPDKNSANKRGCAVELKRINGTYSQVSPYQRKWLADLEKRNWITIVAYGCKDALDKLREVGYNV